MKQLLICLAFIGVADFSTVLFGQTQASAIEASKTHIITHGHHILGEFAELLKIPNVADDLDNIQRNAQWIIAAFKKRGIEMRTLELDEVPPIVFGEWKTPGAKETLVIYVHYDGQPVDPSQWEHDPWTPTLYDGILGKGGKEIPFPGPGEVIKPEWRIYARAAGDDKAPILAILAAIDSMRARKLAPTVNLKFFFEGEEENGSPNLARYLQTYRDLLRADAWLFCDGPTHQSRQAQLVFGVRGIVSMELTVYGATRGLHSGHYGNWAPVPGMMLAQLLAGMKDDSGKVLIKGFYDSVLPLGDEERQAIEQLPEIEHRLMEELGISSSEGAPESLAERLLIPSLTVNGLQSGNVGALARNVIPPFATARLDFRLVKGNQPKAMLDLVEDHIRQQGYFIVRDTPSAQLRNQYPKIVKITRGEGYPAARTSMSLPLAGKVGHAIQAVTGTPPIQMPTLGGSLPLYLFGDILDTPFLVLPIANYDNNQHAANENLQVANLWYAISLYSAIFTMP